MDKKKAPKEKMAVESNGLTDTQEVLYDHEFKKADTAGKDMNKGTNAKNSL
ncbi:YfhE family protein [Domibacillus sp. A3M-37]|uniref:YfhE family protein n=1 Tax=Domibacillus sp. A3M-37 TaxID=2962037 RepID=UPI0020B7C74E|nr:YfhE family protein [Domibacillus sp. A3M-37]MCP3764940.1 YfhE family protein [Domibacillus sp. A3M-37]